MTLWRITPKGPVRVAETALKQARLLEEHLEDWIVANDELLGERLLIIGRQVMIPDIRDRLDVLALDSQGKAVIVELKRGAVDDPVDIQALRYASYIAKWRFQDFENQARIHLRKVGDPNFNFNELYETFCNDAGIDEIPDINTDQRVIIVGCEVKAKIGSVALWLLEHNVDIKVVEIGVYQEGEALLVQPQTIVPLPVSRFSDVGAHKGEGAQPWVENGQSWHLDKRCSAVTRGMLLQLNDLIRDNFEVDGPRWNQKFYVAYRVGHYNWLAVDTQPSRLRLDFLVKAGTFSQEALATDLGVEQFDTEDSLAEKLSLPSSVQVRSRNESIDRVRLRIKEGFDLESEAFLAFLKRAYKAFPK